eukprot:CAMPEP_0185723890 /NCGR_PEP_ID=MMETSP1171-20130828/570_1 /TAXON_ID=374046 /ORGANISM="Helicotheca tamensis, Strain CCMP826" /LENGTH=373 /DNA_ID=CAMNT_0028391657 /DNA_START=27 /DNA_END=1148 /DNA_ORIENTATION=-
MTGLPVRHKKQNLTALNFLLVLAGCATSKSTENIRMNDNGACSSSSSSGSALEQARQLAVPPATSIRNGEVEHFQFWSDYGPLLKNAWKDYEEQIWSDDDDDDDDDDAINRTTPSINNLIEPTLAQAVQNTWDTPTIQNEAIIHSLWKEMPGSNGNLYTTPFLTQDGILYLRQELAKVSASGIPTRRPNGMNRYGLILDETVDGAVHLSTLTSFTEKLVEEYVRPIGRMLFPEYIGEEDDDVESYPFVIRYKLGEDVMLKEHRDASVVTINVNLNLEEEEYGGSSLYFVMGGEEEDSSLSSVRHNVTFSPGMAVMHCGALRHAALPIEAGERHNLVIWLFGKGGEVRIAPYSKEEQLSVEERWTKREVKPFFL